MFFIYNIAIEGGGKYNKDGDKNENQQTDST